MLKLYVEVIYEYLFFTRSTKDFTYGWVIKNQRGSHIQLVHPCKGGKVTVPHPRKELDPKTVKSICNQANIEL